MDVNVLYQVELVIYKLIYTFINSNTTMLASSALRVAITRKLNATQNSKTLGDFANSINLFRPGHILI